MPGSIVSSEWRVPRLQRADPPMRGRTLCLAKAFSDNLVQPQIYCVTALVAWTTRLACLLTAISPASRGLTRRWTMQA